MGALKDQRETAVKEDSEDLQELREMKESQEYEVPRDHRVLMDLREVPVPQDKRDPLVQLVRVEPVGATEIQVETVYREIRENQERLVVVAYKDRKVLEDY